MRHNHWTMKYRSQWTYYILRSPVSHMELISKVWYSSIKTSSRYKGYSIDHEIWVTITYLYIEVTLHITWNYYSRYDISLSNSLRDIRHNHWTMKYRSNWPTYILRSHFMSQETNIQGMAFLYQKVFEIWDIITGPWNIGHTDLIIFWGHSSCHMQLIFMIWLFSIKYSLTYKHNHWTMKYRSNWSTYTLRSF